ncbi:MAG: dihydrodipicolinate synthase family protein [Kouleothrix sp.]|nr:dihydrodipicolinate synthase family protein [Kouleothrix sp.]
MIHGILPALLTPMDADGASVNHATLQRLVEFHIQRGVAGFFVCGGSGEGLLLTPAEREAVLATVVAAVRGRAAVIAHIGALDTATAARLAAHAAGLGVDAVAAVPPVYFRVDDLALVDHYRLIADAAGGTPVYLYNIPSATGVEINARVLARLLELPAIRGIKHSSYDLYDMRTMIELAPGRLTVLSGFDEVCLAGLCMGAHGAIGSTYNVMPATFTALYRAVQSGDLAQAQDLQFRANRVIKALLSVPLIAGLKAVLTDWGYDCGGPRRPQRPLSAAERERLLAAVAAAGLAQLEAEAAALLGRTASL